MKIEWTEPAVADLEGIRDFIRRDSEYYAIRFVERIIEAVENLDSIKATQP
jgi:toxin ParE1/3/4